MVLLDGALSSKDVAAALFDAIHVCVVLLSATKRATLAVVRNLVDGASFFFSITDVVAALLGEISGSTALPMTTRLATLEDILGLMNDSVFLLYVMGVAAELLDKIRVWLVLLSVTRLAATLEAVLGLEDGAFIVLSITNLLLARFSCKTALVVYFERYDVEFNGECYSRGSLETLHLYLTAKTTLSIFLFVVRVRR
jgi:hypothetical protein